MPKVVKAFKGVPDGAHHPIDYAPGDVVSGDLGAVALREGWAVEDAPPATAELAASPPQPQKPRRAKR